MPCVPNWYLDELDRYFDARDCLRTALDAQVANNRARADMGSAAAAAAAAANGGEAAAGAAEAKDGRNETAPSPPPPPMGGGGTLSKKAAAEEARKAALLQAAKDELAFMHKMGRSSEIALSTFVQKPAQAILKCM